MSQPETHPVTKEAVIAAAKTLSREDLWDVCWKLMDERGIVPFVCFSVDDVREDLEMDELDGVISDVKDITDQQILSAIQTASQNDWSDFATSAREAIRMAIDEGLEGEEDDVAA